MAEQNDSLDALNQEQPPRNTTLVPPSTRNNSNPNQVSNYIPDQLKSEKNVDLSRKERIEQNEKIIEASLKNKSKSDTKATSDSYKGVKIEFSNDDKFTNKINNIKDKSESLSSEHRQDIEHHDKVVEEAKKLKNKNHETSKPEFEIKHIEIDENKAHDLDDNFNKRYVVDQKNQYRWAGHNQKVAFRDHGSKLTTKSSNITAHKDMIKLLDSQGVTSINIQGTKEFRSNVWREAKSRGMEVSGHIPSKEDLKSLKPENTIEKNEKTNKYEEKKPSVSQPTEKVQKKTSIDGQREKEIRTQLNSHDRESIAKSEPQLKALISHEKAIKAYAEKYINPKSQDKVVRDVMNIQINKVVQNKDISNIKLVDKELSKAPER